MHYGNKPTKCVIFTLYLFLRVIKGFINIKSIANQQGTLRIVHGRVNPYSNDLIHIFSERVQFDILGISSFLPFGKTKYFVTCRP